MEFISWIKIKNKNDINKKISVSGLVLKVDNKFILMFYNYKYNKIIINKWFSNPLQSFPKDKPDYKNGKHYIKYIFNKEFLIKDI